MRSLVFLPFVCCLACGSSSSSGAATGGSSGFGGVSSGGTAGTSGSGGSAGEVVDAGSDAPEEADAATVDKAALCTDTFGDQLTDSFGRVDGTVLAIVAPDDTRCPLVNNDHLVIEVTMNDAVYRMVVNVDQVYFAEIDVPQLAGGAWEEGWHPAALLDYVTMLKLSSGDFAPYGMGELVQKVSDQIEIGEPISVFATSSGGTYASSAHLVHRNGQNHDGAIVTNPTGTSFHYLTFRFDDQSF